MVVFALTAAPAPASDAGLAASAKTSKTNAKLAA
jgi:hypothetical protein